ncbi:PEP-CTERM sorting domain-containing protein, partial [Oleiharenicola lentus]
FTNQGSLTHSANNSHGQIYAPTFTNEGSITALNTAGYTLTLGQNTQTFTNAVGGTITANGTNTYVDLQGVDNNGTLVATNNGHLRFAGTFTTADLGTVQLSSGGRALIYSGGTLDNTAATLNAVTGGTFELYGGTITGGTINALGFTSSGGTVNNATFNGSVSLAASASANLGGTILFDTTTATFGLNSDLTLNAGAAVTFNAASTGSGDLSLVSSGAGASFTNQGSLTHSANNSHGQIYAPTFTNEGSITALNTAGYTLLTLGAAGQTFTNTASGLVLVNNAIIALNAGSSLNFGTIQVQSGTLNAGSGLSNEAGGIFKGAGTVSGDLTLDGGTLAPGNSIGTLTFTNSDFNVTTASTLEIELSGATADALVFQNPTSAVNLGSGLLALSLQLLSAPSIGNTYGIISIASGGSGITGTFAGLPSSGSTFISNFSGTDYIFSVTYLTNNVNLLAVAAVPEPSTYALLTGGLGLLGLRRLRRRRS